MTFIQAPKENYCPGIEDFVRPSVAYEVCVSCGGRVEIWSDEDSGLCSDCNAEWTKPDKEVSCLDYCEYAETCQEIIETRKPPG